MAETQHPQVAPCGSWASRITSDLIVADAIALSDVFLDQTLIYWIEGRPKEGGRYVLVGQSIADASAKPHDLIPKEFNARTRVHEYGGGAVLIDKDDIYFSNFEDQRLYRITSGGAPTVLTPPWQGERNFRFADGLMDSRRQRWVGIREDHTQVTPETQAVNTITAMTPGDGGLGTILEQGRDFYASVRLSPDGNRLAWLAWDHPHMPWIAAELWVGELDVAGTITSRKRIAGGPQESIFQPEWSPDGTLYFVSDRTNWWNLYRLQGEHTVPVCPKPTEFGQPQWNFGMSTYAFVDAKTIVCTYAENGDGVLSLLDIQRGELTRIDLPYADYASIRALNGKIACRAGSYAQASCVVLYDLATKQQRVFQKSSSVADDPEISNCFSAPQDIEFPTENGKTAFAIYYPPYNPDYRKPDGERPPLVVKCHGGPTAAASKTLDLRIQYWTSRGIAVVDVNYGGSTGYGREYRERLKLTWGIVDVDDCVNAAQYLCKEGLADEQRAIITGGSAGGYTTLAALAFRDFFKGGGSHYGVSDAEALAKDTHKFESHYLDWLIGEYPKEAERYKERSPIHFPNQFQAPVIFFQGDEDKIVPPNQTETIVAALRAKGVPVGFLLFQGEQHGFRQSENIKRALDAELYFYAALVFKVGLTFPKALLPAEKPIAADPRIEFFTLGGAKGPFSEAVRVGEMLYLSGQIGLDAAGKLVPGGIADETRQTMDNIKAVLERHGSSLDKVVKATVMLADMADWPQMNEVYASYFKEHFPARSALGANNLALGAKVEIECFAII